MKAIRCLTRDKERADIYRVAAKIYKKLGDYKDAPEQYMECSNQAKAYRKLAEEDEKKRLEAENAKAMEETSKNTNKNVFRIVRFVVVLLVVVIAVGGVIYLKSKPGRYARASFYERTENYEKSYKMFGNLKTYRDSESRSNECRYEYAAKCMQDKKYEAARKAYRELEDYKDSKENLVSVELQIIQDTEVGGNIFFGEYHWLIAEKEEDKVLLVKSQPINAVTWENSSLRNYLNGEFLSQTFTDSMMNFILDTEITVPDNEKYGTIGGETTTDKVFLLNAEQFTQYSDILNNYQRVCWLINPGNSQDTAQFVSFGEVMDYGYVVTDTNINIRPALWVSVK